MIVFPEPSIPKCSVCEDGAEKKAILVEATTRWHASLVWGFGLVPVSLSYSTGSSGPNCACNVCAAAAVV